MKPVIIGLELTFVAIFFACIISLPFAWRLGSLPASSAWLRGRLPPWLLTRLEKKGRYDPELWIRFVRWISSRAWMAALAVAVVAIIFAAVGLYD